MSYANLVDIVGTTQEELFQRVRDFICKRNGTYDYSLTGIGWTLHDSSYATDEDNLTAGDWIVIYSAGEGGDDDMYQWLEYSGEAAAPDTCAYLYWNNSTHAGVSIYGGISSDLWSYSAAATNYNLFIYGDLDALAILLERDNQADYCYGASMGRLVDGPYNQEILTLSSAYSAGSNVVVTLPSVPSYGYEQWKNIYIRDDAHIEIIQIEAISGNNITVDLVNSYAAGAKIQADHCYLAASGSYFGSSTGTCNSALISRDGVVGGTSNPVLRLSNQSLYAADELQTLSALFAVDYVLGKHDTGFKGVGGRMPNMYNLPASIGMTYNSLYVIAGVSYRYLFVAYSLAMLFREV